MRSCADAAVSLWSRIQQCPGGAVAETADATVLAVGNREADRFETTWQPEHFRGVPAYDDNPGS
jgi:hypothetical protein